MIFPQLEQNPGELNTQTWFSLGWWGFSYLKTSFIMHLWQSQIRKDSSNNDNVDKSERNVKYQWKKKIKEEKIFALCPLVLRSKNQQTYSKYEKNVRKSTQTPYRQLLETVPFVALAIDISNEIAYIVC